MEMIDRLLFGVLALVASLTAGCTGTSDPEEGPPDSIVAYDLALAIGQSETRTVATHCGYERLELIDQTTLSVRASGSDVSHDYHRIETEPWCE